MFNTGKNINNRRTDGQNCYINIAPAAIKTETDYATNIQILPELHEIVIERFCERFVDGT